MVTLVWNKQDVKEIYASFFEEGEPFDVMELPRNYLGSVWGRHGDEGRQARRGIDVPLLQLSLQADDLAVHDRCCPPRAGNEVVVVWGRPGSRQKNIRAIVARAPYKLDNRVSTIDLGSLPNEAPI